MNQADFQQNGGFPLETNTLNFMQSAYNIFNAFGALAGSKTIISGCEMQGNEVTNGYVYVNGELLEFRGGIKQNTVVIIEDKESAEFEDGAVKEVYKTRYATFGAAGNSIPWADFKKTDTLLALLGRVKNLEDTILKPATTTEIAAGVVADKYISPYTFPKNMLRVLHSATHHIGNIPAEDWNTTITFPSINTSNYLIIGNLVSKSNYPFAENDIAWVYFGKTPTSFSLSFREISGGTKNFDFEYSIIAM